MKPGRARNLYVSLGRLARYKRLAKRGAAVLSAFLVMERPMVEPGMYGELEAADAREGSVA